MAEHTPSSGNVTHGYEAHKATYEGFLKGSVALTVYCLYILLALIAFRFVGNFNVLLGFAGLVIGAIAVLIDMRAGNKWYLSVGWLVIFGLITAVMVA
jgi:hypothetical protein